MQFEKQSDSARIIFLGMKNYSRKFAIVGLRPLWLILPTTVSDHKNKVGDGADEDIRTIDAYVCV